MLNDSLGMHPDLAQGIHKSLKFNLDYAPGGKNHDPTDSTNRFGPEALATAIHQELGSHAEAGKPINPKNQQSFNKHYNSLLSAAGLHLQRPAMNQPPDSSMIVRKESPTGGSVVTKVIRPALVRDDGSVAQRAHVHLD